MSKAREMLIELKAIPTTRTTLQCIVCGDFLGHQKRKKHFALVIPVADDSDACALSGLHQECAPPAGSSRSK